MLTARRTWTDEAVEAELRSICDELGRFPSCGDLRERGRNDLACRITRSGGILAWSERLGLPRSHSDSDTGWEGEMAAMARLSELGFAVVRPRGVKSPFDLLVDGLLRVDVKSARHAAYGSCAGWFYRIGKLLQADLLLLWQLDTGDFYAMPWHAAPSTNITISRDGGKYAAMRNNADLIRAMLELRRREIELVQRN